MERDELDPLVEEIIRSVDGIPPAALEALGRVLMRSAGAWGSVEHKLSNFDYALWDVGQDHDLEGGPRLAKLRMRRALRLDAHEPDDLLERLADIDAPPWASIREAVRYVSCVRQDG